MRTIKSKPFIQVKLDNGNIGQCFYFLHDQNWAHWNNNATKGDWTYLKVLP